MTTHLKGRPCREATGGMESDTMQLNRVTCGRCRESKKYERLCEKASRPQAKKAR